MLSGGLHYLWGVFLSVIGLRDMGQYSGAASSVSMYVHAIVYFAGRYLLGDSTWLTRGSQGGEYGQKISCVLIDVEYTYKPINAQP